jgi:hypothetical protein
MYLLAPVHHTESHSGVQNVLNDTPRTHCEEMGEDVLVSNSTVLFHCSRTHVVQRDASYCVKETKVELCDVIHSATRSATATGTACLISHRVASGGCRKLSITDPLGPGYGPRSRIVTWHVTI